MCSGLELASHLVLPPNKSLNGDLVCVRAQDLLHNHSSGLRLPLLRHCALTACVQRCLQMESHIDACSRQTVPHCACLFSGLRMLDVCASLLNRAVHTLSCFSSVAFESLPSAWSADFLTLFSSCRSRRSSSRLKCTSCKWRTDHQSPFLPAFGVTFPDAHVLKPRNI